MFTRSTKPTPINVPDPDLAVGFLHRLRPQGPWTVASIDPKPQNGKKPIPLHRTFIGRDDIDGMRRWVAAHNGKLNLHFIPNPTRGPTGWKKPAESDIGFYQYAHADLDPLEGEAAADAIARHRAKLKSGIVPLPTFIYTTGNGVTALWRIRPAVKLTTPEDIAICKANNVGLIEALGGKAEGNDKCQSLEHLLRLPYTVNIPDARKRAKGRKVELAGDVEHNRVAYSDFDFPAGYVTPPPRPFSGEAVVTFDLAELPTSARVKAIIMEGRVPGEMKRGDDSRSVWEAEAICTMLRDGIAPDVILGLLTDPDYGISERVLAKPNPEQYARGEIDRLRAKVKATVLSDFFAAEGE